MPNRKQRSTPSSGKSASTDVRPKRTRSATERVEQEAPDVVQLQQSGRPDPNPGPRPASGIQVMHCKDPHTHPHNPFQPPDLR